MARKLDWLNAEGEPNKMRVSRRLADLDKAGLIKEKLGQYRLTPAGVKAAKEAEREGELLNANAAEHI